MQPLCNRRPYPSPHRRYLHRTNPTSITLPRENLTFLQSFLAFKFPARMLIRNFDKSLVCSITSRNDFHENEPALFRKTLLSNVTEAARRRDEITELILTINSKHFFIRRSLMNPRMFSQKSVKNELCAVMQAGAF